MTILWPTRTLIALTLALFAPAVAGQVRPCGPGTPACLTGWFCELPVSDCDPATAGLCTEIPASCPGTIEPVCGCDGQTYLNSCLARQSEVSVAAVGACFEDQCNGNFCVPGSEFCKEPAGFCNPFRYDVCFIEGDLFLPHHPDAFCAPIPTGCPTDIDPVCSCAGVTFDNACLAEQAGLSIFEPGLCPQKCVPNAGIYCTTPGEVCYLECDGCHIADLDGWCFEQPTDCPPVCRPICACDGTTQYRNRCESQAVPEIVMRYEGACGEILDLMFVDRTTLQWQPNDSAGLVDDFNVYRSVFSGVHPPGPWSCHTSGHTQSSIAIPGAPPSGQVWFYGVAGVASGVEQTLGFGSSDCTERTVQSPCAP